MHRGLACATVLIVLATAHAKAAPPQELYGKTVAITWTETREQRPEGTQDWHTVNGTATMNIYVSEAGRVFNNIAYATRRGYAERKGEIAGSGSRRSVDFNGRSLVLLTPSGAGGATRITADFDQGFSSCSAQVTRATEAPGTIIRRFSGISKQFMEVKSTQVGSVSCSIRSGNAFADSPESRTPQIEHHRRRW